jgi:Cu-Zn family superoxide dismutase
MSTAHTLGLAVLASLYAISCNPSREELGEQPSPRRAIDEASAAEALQPFEPRIGHALIQAATGQEVTGAAVFIESVPGQGVDMFVTLDKLGPGNHGLHIHETGTCGGMGFESAGEHFNPGGTAHGAPQAPAHHAGDLGNVQADERGRAELHIVTRDVSLDPKAPISIARRAVIVHANPDDLQSQPGGNAGGRIGCGVVEVLSADEPRVGS